MSLLVVGSVALDSVETPGESRSELLGGSAVYFSYAASYFTPVHLVGVVGDDWPTEYTELLERRQIDTLGLQVVSGSKTFRWRGKYLPNMNDRETLEVHLNVFGQFNPVVPDRYQDSPFVFLANGSPRVQMRVLEQLTDVQLSVADTMDLWIREEHDALLALLQRIDGLVLNDSEAKLLTGDENLVRAGLHIREMGPKFVIIKKGEHGALFFWGENVEAMPAFPTPRVVDPTGAGDSFAGGMMGYLAENRATDVQAVRRGLGYGTVVASYNVEDFSLDRMREIERADLDQRYEQLRSMLDLE